MTGQVTVFQVCLKTTPTSSYEHIKAVFTAVIVPPHYTGHAKMFHCSVKAEMKFPVIIFVLFKVAVLLVLNSVIF